MSQTKLENTIRSSQHYKAITTAIKALFDFDSRHHERTGDVHRLIISKLGIRMNNRNQAIIQLAMLDLGCQTQRKHGGIKVYLGVVARK